MGRATRMPQWDALSPEAQAIVDAAARRGIPTSRIAGDPDLVLLGDGHPQRLLGLASGRTSHNAIHVAADPLLANALLHAAGLPVPEAELVATVDQALATARAMGMNVVMKPLDAGPGRSPILRTPGAVRAAFEALRRLRTRILMEPFVEGDRNRVVIVAGRMLCATKRSAPSVTGNGQHAIRALVAADPGLAVIAFDEATAALLARQGLSADAVAPAGVTVALGESTDPARGGRAEDITARVHPAVVQACERAAAVIGLDVCAIDVACRDIGRALEPQGGAIVGVSAEPRLGGAQLREAAERVVRSLVPAAPWSAAALG